MSLVLDEHREYLADSNRVDAFRRAISACVRAGDVVLDLASGTGILGLLACQAGASRVYAIEQSGLAGLARDIAAANGFGDRVTVIREHSLRADLPEHVDCIVCDQIGHFGFEAGLLQFTDDARRWLKPGGHFVPERIQLWISPVEHEDVRQRLAFWSTRPAQLDFTAATAIARNTGYPVMLEPQSLLAEPRALASIELPCSASGWIGGAVDFTIARDGVLDGVGGWFVAELAAGVTLTNAPGHSARIYRRNVVFPVAAPVSTSAGDRVRVAVRIRPIDMIVSWQLTVTRPDGESLVAAQASTFAGFLLSREDVARTSPGAHPRLTRAGEARRALLLLIDGTHTVAEIERALQREFPELLPSHERAAEFVAEVLSGYTTATPLELL